jgi:hypothetical protein
LEDIRACIEKLLTDAEDCALIGKLAMGHEKREVFKKLAEDYRKMARELETIAISGVIPEDQQNRKPRGAGSSIVANA